MADEPQTTPEPKTSPGELFTKQLRQLASCAQSNANAVLEHGPTQWYCPADFESSLFDLEKISEPFDRKKQAEEFRQAVANPKSRGTTTDLAMVQLQGDLLAAMERAYRVRHSSGVRSKIQTAGRLAGHAAETGVIPLGMLGFIIGLDRQNKSEQA